MRFSLANQLEIDPFFFREEPEEKAASSRQGAAAAAAAAAPAAEEGYKAVGAAVSMLEQELGILSATDLVLNHTASNSPWLADHPEAG